jgi:hypothetical protein
MLVNLNSTISPSGNVMFNPDHPLMLPGIGAATSTPVEVWTWSGHYTKSGKLVTSLTPAPVAQYFPQGLPANWVLPNQTVALIEAYPGGGVPVTFNAQVVNATGAVSHPPLGRWYVRVNGFTAESNNTSSITLFEPSGLASVMGVPIPLPLRGIERVNKERYEPLLPSTVEIPEADVGTNNSVSQNFSFVEQWATNVSFDSIDPSTAGAVGPAPSWWDNGTRLNLSAKAAFGYVFTNWVVFENATGNVTFQNHTNNSTPKEYFANQNVTGWTYLNVSGLSPTIAPWVNGSLQVKATLARAYPVTFVESGLPSGTPWSITVRTTWNDTENATHHVAMYAAAANYTNASGPPPAIHDWNFTGWANKSTTTNYTAYSNESLSSMEGAISDVAANGTYAFSVSNVSGYRSHTVSANFTVQGARVSIPTIYFSRITGYPSTYPVAFTETGLPSGTRWSITVRNDTNTSTGTTVTFAHLLNGSYGYRALTIPGFQAHPSAYGFVVNGPGLVVNVTYAPVRYDVVWVETGLGNLTWGVDVSGQTIPSNGAWTTDPLTNGTYTFNIPDVLDFIPQLRSETFTVNGEGQAYAVQFLPASFNVTFMFSGDPANDAMTVRFSNIMETLTDPPATFSEPNGTYTFNVTPPDGYVAVPSHGSVVVAGQAQVIRVSLDPLGPPAIPPIWNLALPAVGATVAIALAGWGTFLLIGGRKRRRSGAKP